MATFLYSPGDRVVIETISAGTLDVSDDMTQGSLTRRKGVSTFVFSLRNARRKYDNVFTPNDRISVMLRRVRWLPVFTGYLDQVPIFTSYPRDVQMKASCSLKKLQYFPVDTGAPAMVELLGLRTMDDMNSIDGGLKQKALKVLDEVVGWDRAKIHIGEIPSSWVKAIEDVWDNIKDDLAIPQALLGSSFTAGGGTVAGMGPTTVPGIGAGTGRLPDTHGKISSFGGPGGGAYGNMALTGESGVNPRDPWYCAMRWPYVDDHLRGNGAVAGAKQWWTNRKILVRCGRSGKMVCLRAADWGPNISTGRVLDISPHAMTVLAAGTDWEVDITFAPSGVNCGPVSMVPGSDIIGGGGGGRGGGGGGNTGPQGGQPSASGGQGTGYFFPVAGHFTHSDTWGSARSGGRHHLGDDIMCDTGTPLVAVFDGVITKVSNEATPNVDDGTGTFNANSFHLKCDDGRTWFYTHNNQNFCRTGQRVRGGDHLANSGHSGNASISGPHLHISLSVGNPQPDQAEDSSTAINPYPPLHEIELTGTILDGASGGAGGGAASGLAALVNAYNWSGSGPSEYSSLLVGERAIMNDTTAYALVDMLMRASMREFCSAPNGDIIAWFPDYFGTHSTLAKMVIEDIEVEDFSITWNDSAMKTHQFVMGSPYSNVYAQEPGGPVDAWQKIITKGVVTMEHPEIIRALLGIKTGGKDLPFRFDDPKAVFSRFGARAAVHEMPGLPDSDLAEFWRAVYEFNYNWASQFSTQIRLSFMPELYPGMLAVFPSIGIQAYVEEVQHDWTYGDGGGFSTTISVIAPSATNGSGFIGLLPKAGVA